MLRESLYLFLNLYPIALSISPAHFVAGNVARCLYNISGLRFTKCGNPFL
ncbi:hypothetical protein JMJ77_0012312, partial [Colletotrichum scovillei]